ncbi:MAG: heme o synthase [Chloroflexota bacterium]
MKSRFKLTFRQLALLLLGDVLLLSLAGRLVADHDPLSVCSTWPFCIPIPQSAWFKIAHLGLAGLAGILVLQLLVAAWKEYRADTTVLPLTTVAAVLFLGQAFVGAVLIGRDYRLDLVVLHAATAVSLWVSLVALAVVSVLRTARAGQAAVPLGSRHWRDFLALSKPWIVALLLVTTFGGLVAGGRALPPLGLAIWTLVGGALAAAGSSALNQYIDRDLDKNMQRTARRPLPAGRLTPAEGLSYGLALCLVSYYLLAGLVNLTAALLSLGGIFYYVVFYSILLKRATVQNIVVGGGAGAIPPMVGWAAAAGQLSLAAWILFLIIFLWTPPHFWALAIVRMKDYEKAGVPMLPVVKGEMAARRQILLYTVALVGSTLLLPLVGAAGVVYTIAAALLGALLLAVAWRVWRVPGNKVAWTMYRWSSMYLMFIFMALVVDSLM